MKNISKITNLFFQENPNMFWYLLSIYYPFSNTELAIHRDHVYWGYAVFGETSVGLHDSIDIGLNCNTNLKDCSFDDECFKISKWNEGIIPADFYSGAGTFSKEDYLHVEVCSRLPLDSEGGSQIIDSKQYNHVCIKVEKEYNELLEIKGSEEIFQIFHLLQEKIQKVKNKKLPSSSDHDSEFELREFLLFNPLIWTKHFSKIINPTFMENANIIVPSWVPKDDLPF